MISFTRILVLTVFLYCFTHQLAAQTETKTERSLLMHSTDAHIQSEITTTIRDGIRYMAIDDLARFTAGRTYANTILKKTELILPSVRFKCTAESPFIIITHQSDGSQSVYQLTRPVTFRDGVFNLPASEFLTLFEIETHQKILIAPHDAASQTTAAAVRPSGIQSVPASQKIPSDSQITKRSIAQQNRQSALPGQNSAGRSQDAPSSDAQKEPARRQDQLSVGSAEKSDKYSVTGIDIEEKRNGFLLRIHTSERLPDAEKVLQGGEWLYITIPKAKGNVSDLGGLFPTGLVKRVIPMQSAQGLQLSFQLREKVESAELIQSKEDTDILIALRTASKRLSEAASVAQDPDAALAVRQPTRIETNAERQKNKWKLDVVVLDAGHGGHDPGTIGSMGTHEKDVTLGIALKLGALIEKNMPGVKVIYTRTTDNFVELYRRGQIANEAGGKLFISIHCNSTPKKSTAANGFEIYLLRPGKTENAIEIAEQENAVVRLEKNYENRYQRLTDENFIILTMAQSAYVKQSERFAEILETEMGKKMVYQSRGVKQAGFYVLVGASMPNVLIETGYLSNRKDETLLRGLAGQYLAAQSIYDGLKKFKTEYEHNFAED